MRKISSSPLQFEQVISGQPIANLHDSIREGLGSCCGKFAAVFSQAFANPFRPQRCRHTGRVASPVETIEYRAFPAESVGKLDDVAAPRDLLPTPHDSVENKAGWAESASVWGDDPRSCSRQDRSHFIESMYVVGEAVRQDHRPAAGWTVFERKRSTGNRS
jgi:hypothetical protein